MKKRENQQSCPKLSWHLADNKELENFSQRMEKFDQQQPENKLSGSTVALIVCGCLVGAGLVGVLLCLALRKKKN